MRRVLLENDPEGYARTCEALATADLSEAVRSVKAPVLVLCGREDAPPFQHAVQWFTDNLADVRLSGCPAGTPPPTRTPSRSRTPGEVPRLNG